MSEERDLLAEAAAYFAEALADWRDLRFMLEIEEERRRDFLGEGDVTRDNGDYHVELNFGRHYPWVSWRKLRRNVKPTSHR